MHSFGVLDINVCELSGFIRYVEPTNAAHLPYNHPPNLLLFNHLSQFYQSNESAEAWAFTVLRQPMLFTHIILNLLIF